MVLEGCIVFATVIHSSGLDGSATPSTPSLVAKWRPMGFARRRKWGLVVCSVLYLQGSEATHTYVKEVHAFRIVNYLVRIAVDNA
jgi:hypothetical protein